MRRGPSHMLILPRLRPLHVKHALDSQQCRGLKVMSMGLDLGYSSTH